MKHQMRTQHPFNKRAMTLIEAVFAMLIVSVMLTAALNTVGSARQGERKIALQSQGNILAQELMAEIFEQQYADRILGVNDFGLTVNKALSGNRKLFDDVDDYDNWSATPPEDKQGKAIPGMDNWTREVEVEWVDPDDLTTVVLTNKGVKRVIVTVKNEKRTVTTLQAYRTGAWQTGRENE